MLPDAGSIRAHAEAFRVPKVNAQQPVPLAQGRELEWLFASAEGQWAVGDDCMARRVILVALGRGHVYQGVASVNKELSPLVCNSLMCRVTADSSRGWSAAHSRVCHMILVGCGPLCPAALAYPVVGVMD